jgi:cytochrome c
VRHPTALLAAVGLAALLIGCSKPAPKTETAEAPEASEATEVHEVSDADKLKMLASLPAPYNAADMENGKRKFALCRSCHTITEGGPNMTGPNLYGIIGHKAGSHEGYAYSDALKAAGYVWDPAHLDTWITDPKAMLPGNKMTFLGLKEAKDRTDVIAYLMVETGAAKPAHD